MYDHCHRSSHTIEEYKTLKNHYKLCDKRGHMDDPCRLKNNKVGLPKYNWGSQGKISRSATNLV